MEKTLKVLECININEWYNKMRQEKKLDGLTVKTLWALRKNMKKIQDVVDSFNEFKEGLENDLKAEFFTEEKSEDSTMKNENDEDVSIKKIKEEYMGEYQSKVEEINDKLRTLVYTDESLTFSPIDMEQEVERIGEECILDMDDLDVLSIFEDKE